MDIDGYYSELERLADEYLDYSLFISPYDFLEKKGLDPNHLAIEMIAFRKTFFGLQEELKLETTYMKIWPVFLTFEEEERKIWFLVSMELEECATRLRYKKKCEIYRQDQPLFLQAPQLWTQVRNGDLIPIENVEHIEHSELVLIFGLYSKLDKELNPNIIEWASSTYPHLPKFIRINPYRIFKSRPIQSLNEATLHPADPKWITKLLIFNNTKKGASYILENGGEHLQIYEYLIKKIRRLDVIAQRKNSGVFSMMIEELQQESDDIVIGRCIHLDSSAPLGTNYEEVKLSHLDLAINVYFDDTGRERMASNLANGNKVTNATCRTHLFRIDDVPLSSLMVFARMFFNSMTLLDEWTAEQFKTR